MTTRGSQRPAAGWPAVGKQAVEDAGQYAAEAADPACLDVRAAAGLLRAAPWRRLLLMGDSVAAGNREAVPGYRDRAWLDRVADALAARPGGLTVRNLGTPGALAHEIRRDQLAAALEFRPDLAAVAAGGNDMMRRSFDPDTVEEHLDAMVGALRATGATVLTVGLFDITRSGLVPEPYASGMHARLRALTERTAAVAARHGALFVSFTEHPASADPGIWSSDGIHLNCRGHAIAGAAAIRLLADHVAAEAAAGAAVG